MAKQKVIMIGVGLPGSLVAVYLTENTTIFRFAEILKDCLEK